MLISPLRVPIRRSSTAMITPSSSSCRPFKPEIAAASTFPHAVSLCSASTYSRRARNRHIELYTISSAVDRGLALLILVIVFEAKSVFCSDKIAAPR
jgi:hypothetical protein